MGLSGLQGVSTMMPAERVYLDVQRDKLSSKAAFHREKGARLVADGFEVSGQYDLDQAAYFDKRVLEVSKQIEELRNGV